VATRESASDWSLRARGPPTTVTRAARESLNWKAIRAQREIDDHRRSETLDGTTRKPPQLLRRRLAL
jgi:hypothetical protein